MTRNLDDAIADAGRPQTLLWESQTPATTIAGMAPEFTNWRDEQLAWRRTSVLFDQSHHMWNLNVKGPDALKLISDTAVNSTAYFPVDAAKQYVAVNGEGNLIGDNILFRYEEDEFQAVGMAATINWLQFHAETGGYDVELWKDAPSAMRQGPPRVYRYEVQGPGAIEVIREAVGQDVPSVKFFHGARMTIGGVQVRALRHGMAGEPGFEFVGPWEEREAVHEALLAAGQKHGMVQVGGRAYLTNTLESGWLPRPLPAIYTGESTAAHRRWLSDTSPDARASLGGSFFSPDVEDYYFTPYDLDYGRIVKFDHDFIGRSALEAQVADGTAQANKKVTLVWNREDTAKIMGSMFDEGIGAKHMALPLANYATYQYDRVQTEGGDYVGRSNYVGYSSNERSILSISVVDAAHAEPGTEVVVLWGENPASSKVQVEDHRQVAVRATVQPAPLVAKARSEYRSNTTASA
ncbi:aminomethyl transferase family protein [Klenkia sp. LSe6-5]|uniref:Aminomethyl transferase family protein n=1 Tax=Klenkia sesuvii TaxID=3103137 RepID=A0ABU8DSW8_9ACTN